MRYAETHRRARLGAGGVCHTDLGDAGERASGYFSAPWEWARIQANQDWIGIFHSADDPLIPVAEARFVAARLGASYFESADRGHFIDDGPFPELVQFVRRKTRALSGSAAGPYRILTALRPGGHAPGRWLRLSCRRSVSSMSAPVPSPAATAPLPARPAAAASRSVGARRDVGVLGVAGLAAMELRWTRTFEAPYPALAASADPAIVADGEYLGLLGRRVRLLPRAARAVGRARPRRAAAAHRSSPVPPRRSATSTRPTSHPIARPASAGAATANSPASCATACGPTAARRFR